MCKVKQAEKTLRRPRKSCSYLKIRMNQSLKSISLKLCRSILKVKKSRAAREMDTYAGYLYCADCGSRLCLHRYQQDSLENDFFCDSYQILSSAKTTVLHTILRKRFWPALCWKVSNVYFSLQRRKQIFFIRWLLKKERGWQKNSIKR